MEAQAYQYERAVAIQQMAYTGHLRSNQPTAKTMPILIKTMKGRSRGAATPQLVTRTRPQLDVVVASSAMGCSEKLSSHNDWSNRCSSNRRANSKRPLFRLIDVRASVVIQVTHTHRAGETNASET